MNEKKMAGVFLWSCGGMADGLLEKRKNENLIVAAQSGEKPFSWDVFPNSMRDQAFDPGYAERVAEYEIQASETLSRIDLMMEIPLYEYDTEDFPGWMITPGGVNFLVMPLLLATPPLEVIAAVENLKAKNDVRSPGFQKKLGEFVERFMGKAEEKFRKHLDEDAVAATMPEPAAVSSPEVSSPSSVSPLKTLYKLDAATGKVSIVDPESQDAASRQVLQEGYEKLMKQPSPASSDPEPEEFVQGFLRDEIGLNDEEIEYFRDWMGKMITEKVWTQFRKDQASSASNSMPSDSESAGVSDVLPPPGFVAVPLPDDGKPVLDYCRKPGHYLTFNSLFVDLTYNVGTGVDQVEGKLEFPWVHFDPLRRGLAWHVFYTPYGKAYSWNGLADGRNQFSYLPACDVVKRCVSVASDSPQDVQSAREATAAPATVNDVPDLTIEQIQQAVGPDCVVTVNFTPKNRAYRCTADAEYRLLEKGEVIQEGDEVDCCVNPMKDDAKWRPVSARVVGDTAPDPVFPSHRIFRRKLEKDTVTKPDASAVDSHVVTSPVPDSCGVDESELRRLFHERTMKEGICGCGTCFGVAKPYLVEVVKLKSSLEKKWDWLAKENHQLVESLARAEKDVADVKAMLGKRDAECDNLRREVERLNAEFTPRDNGDGTVTAWKPVTYPAALDVVEVKSPKRGDHFVSGRDTALVCNLDSIDGVRLILHPVQKPPEPVTWEAPALTDGLWKAGIYEVGNDEFGLPWGALRGITKPAKLGTYQFKDGVGTLIKEERKEGSEWVRS